VAVRSLKILVIFYFPSKTTRLWLGSGPFLDGDGNIWRGVNITENLDTIEAAINGEATRLPMGVSGVSKGLADGAWREIEEEDVIGSKMQIMLQKCNEFDDPVGERKVRFTGTVDNAMFSDEVQGDSIVSTVQIECVNRFDLRTVSSEVVISDIDQKARAAMLNPGAPPDRIAERLPKLADKTIRWPVRR
jgi:hypothetical protein